MNKGGLVIRLIDIALIILFGFIGISDINVRAEVKLPTPIKSEFKKDAMLYATVRVKLENTYEIEFEDEVQEVNSKEALEKALLDLKVDLEQKKQQLMVLIEPQDDTNVQSTIDLMDVCIQHNIPKNIAYDYAKLKL